MKWKMDMMDMMDMMATTGRVPWEFMCRALWSFHSTGEAGFLSQGAAHTTGVMFSPLLLH